MYLPRIAMISALTFSLTACGTIVNGVDTSPHPAQGGGSFCERNLVLCIGGGVLIAGGIALAAAGHGYHRTNSSGTGTGGTGSGMGGGY